MIKKLADKISTVFLILYIFVLLLLWTELRAVLFRYHPLVEVFASLFQDVIWIPLGLLLPFMIALLAVKSARYGWLKKLSALLFFAIFVLIVMNMSNAFKYLFYLVIPFSALAIYHIFHFKRLGRNQVLFLVAIVLLVSNYRGQLFPAFKYLSFHTKRSITIMSYNIRVYMPGERREEVISTIVREKPDIVFIQEINPDDRVLFRQQLHAMFPHQFFSDRFEDYNGGVILSKFPFIRTSNIDIKTQHMEEHTNLNYAMIRIGNQDIHLYNCHLYPNGHELIEAMMGRRSFASFLSQSRIAYNRRIAEGVELFGILKSADGPLIVAGDFNDTPNSQIYNLFSGAYTNAFKKAGWGLGTTFGHSSLVAALGKAYDRFIFDILRIDHVFLSDHFHVLNAAVLPSEASDHRAQIVRVMLK